MEGAFDDRSDLTRIICISNLKQAKQRHDREETRHTVVGRLINLTFDISA